jgi:hypothetical protein
VRARVATTLSTNGGVCGFNLDESQRGRWARQRQGVSAQLYEAAQARTARRGRREGGGGGGGSVSGCVTMAKIWKRDICLCHLARCHQGMSLLLGLTLCERFSKTSRKQQYVSTANNTFQHQMHLNEHPAL